jgi:hypothetical protein
MDFRNDIRKAILLGGSLLLLIFSTSIGAAAQSWTQLAPTGGPPTPRGFHGTTSVYDPGTNHMIIFGGRGPTLCEFCNLNDVWILKNANGLGGTPQWINLIPNGAPGSPLPRSGHSAVYDSTSNRMIIFGGCFGGCLPTLNDVWVLTNANGMGGTPTWIPLVPSGVPPAPRTKHTAVYDPASNRMIVFAGQDGGGNGCSTFPEVWALTNANGIGGTPAWIQLSPTGGPPPGQYGPTAVYDPAGNRMTVFGGSGLIGSLCDDTNAVWVLSNANGVVGSPAWTNLIPEGAAASPSPRNFHSAVYDTSSNRMTIFGGATNTGLVNDVWVLTNSNGLGATRTWTQLSPTGGPPAPRCCHGAILDVASNRMNIFAGDGSAAGADFNDTWVLAGANGIETSFVSYTVSYYANANTVGAPDATVRFINDGTLGDTSPTGDLCAAIYVFDNTEQMQECCSCKVTPNGYLALGVNPNLTSNNPGKSLHRGVIKVISSTPSTTAGSCDATNIGEQPGIHGWMSHVQKTNPGFQFTEGALKDATLDAAELADLQEDCVVITQPNGITGVCSCADIGR